ncbi:hypothetical protein [Streptomyces sp. NPDC048644]|uniref:hypothetical protein n=1 Tax=Streptomyces sp. NPDC048644 TaxID=3365582 RepID=UPI0037198305
MPDMLQRRTGKPVREGDSKREVGDEEFMSLAKDEAKARMLRKMMQNLAEGDTKDPLTQLARDVMSGRSSIQDAVRDAPQDESLVLRFESFQGSWDTMSENDKWTAERAANAYLDEQRREIVAERDTAARTGTTPPRHSARG